MCMCEIGFTPHERYYGMALLTSGGHGKIQLMGHVRSGKIQLVGGACMFTGGRGGCSLDWRRSTGG